MFEPKDVRIPIPEQFKKLRNMESFSQDMFNRIIEFQERLHPAWDPAQSFDDRIRGLPLHALIFSNPDRNPAVQAQTVAAFYPLRAEMRQIAQCAREVAADPIVCDVHGRNGFLGSLLGREGVAVIGLTDPADKPNQISSFYDPRHYTPLTGTIDTIDRPFDVAFSAWMPAGINRTPAILRHRPKLIVFIHTGHDDESTGKPQTGTPEAFRDPPSNYALIAEWNIERPQDLLHEVWPDLTPSIAENRLVKIYADEPYHGIPVAGELEAIEPYDWEKDLDMALTAYEAKAALRAKGMPV